MHEMALCTEVVNTVVETAEEANAVRVNEVSMVIGEMRDIIIDMFDGFFHYLARGTVAEGASVVYTTVPLMVRCKECNEVFHLDLQESEKPLCPACGSGNYEMVSGMEFLIESIDVTTREEAEAPSASTQAAVADLDL